MEVDDLYKQMAQTGMFQLPEQVKEIDKKLDRVNGQTAKNTWNIRAIWTIFSTALGVGIFWLRSRLGGD